MQGDGCMRRRTAWKSSCKSKGLYADDGAASPPAGAHSSRARAQSATVAGSSCDKTAWSSCDAGAPHPTLLATGAKMAQSASTVGMGFALFTAVTGMSA